MLSCQPICTKYQNENNNILGLNTSELRFRGVQKPVLELETRSRAGNSSSN